jgi:signal transduction histidine kinase
MNAQHIESQEKSWILVLRPDGVVDDVQGGAPVTWRGHPLFGASNVPEAVQEAARALLADERGEHWLHHRRVPATAVTKVPVNVVMCDAVPLRRSLVVVRDLVMRVLDLFRQQAPVTGIELQLDYAETVPVSFVADGEKITWAVSTLVGTALRHLREGSKGPRRVSIMVDYEVASAELLIRVSDNGPGIPPERRRWLFETDPATGRSTGLALTMVRDVVLAHRGSIEVGARPGGGTSVTLRIPRPAR